MTITVSPLTIEPDPNQNTEVPWYSALLALVPIALNTMTQPSGIILACPSKYGFILRSSPIVCVLDTIQLVFSIAKECCLLKSPRAAITKVAVYRFRDANEAEEGSLGKLQKNTTVRWIIFLIGAVPQIIKLYAMSGVPITKMWSSMYLSSFVVIELMVRTVGDDWKSSNVNDPSVGTFMDIDRWSAGRFIAMYLSILISIMAPLPNILFGKSSQIIHCGTIRNDDRIILIPFLQRIDVNRWGSWVSHEQR